LLSDLSSQRQCRYKTSTHGKKRRIDRNSFCQETIDLNVWIRDTELDDIPLIFRLRNDSCVQLEQYRPGFFDTPKSFARKLASGRTGHGVAFQCSSILVDDELVGHVMQYKLKGPKGPVYHCGWNLEPRFWGRGIMPEALTSLFNRILDTEPSVTIMAACFATNSRGIRVIEKLGFRPCRLEFSMRVGHLIAARGFRKVLQFRLTRLADSVKCYNSV